MVRAVGPDPPPPGVFSLWTTLLCGQNTKEILYKIRREAPGFFWRTLFGQNPKGILYKIRREAPENVFEDPFWAKYKGNPIHAMDPNP